MKIKVLMTVLFGFLRLSSQKSQSQANQEPPPIAAQPVKDHHPQEAEGKFKLPNNLSDANQDGKVDEADFIRGFANLEMTTWEIKQVFSMADFKKEGQIDIKQWRLFRGMFVAKFEASDADQNLFISAEEFKVSFADLPSLTKVFEDDALIAQIVNDISGRIDKDAGSLNFFEWMFIRQCAVAWTVGSGRKDVITKDELLDIGLKVMPHYSAYEGQLKNIFFSALEFKGYDVHYSFLDVVNIFHKFLIFESMKKHNSVNGSITIPQIIRAIDEHVGPAELFTVAQQERMFNLEQAFYLRDQAEETGVDFPNFYALLRCIYAVKQYGKTNYGSLSDAEFEQLITAHPFFLSMSKYITNSHVMVGAHDASAILSPESEAYIYSSGQNHPVNTRFKQNDDSQMRLRRTKKIKSLNKSRVDNPQANDLPVERLTNGEKDFKPVDPPIKYFYRMYSSHVYLATQTWGDLYRLYKYFHLFQEWDDRKGSRLFLVYPNQLTEIDLQQYEGTFFLKEKDIISNFVISFRDASEVHRVTFDLPIDYLCFTRYFAYDGLVQALSRQNRGELISYHTLYFIFNKMGLILYNGDVKTWAHNLNQGMNSFEALDKPDQQAPKAQTMVNGIKAFYDAQIRSASQIAGKFYFNDDENYPTPVGYQTKRKRKMKRNLLRSA